MSPNLRFLIARSTPSEGIRTLFDPNSMRGYSYLKSKPRYKKIKMKSGVNVAVDINDIIGYRAALNKSWDDTSLNIIKQFKVSETLYIDIGANIGLTSIPIAKLGYETIAFEPNPFALTQLTNNLSLNSPLKYCLFPFALGKSIENSEYIKLYSPLGNLGATSVNGEWSPGLVKNKTIYAPMISLDKAVAIIFTKEKLKSFRNILIKIDVEGFEDEVIEGAREVIDFGRPVILFENNPPMFPNREKNRFWTTLEKYEFVVISDQVKHDFDPEKRYENVLAIPHEKLKAIRL